MTRLNDISALNLMQYRSSLDCVEYCRLLAGKIERELSEDGRCDALSRLTEMARQSGKLATLEYIAVCIAAMSLCESDVRFHFERDYLPGETEAVDDMFFIAAELMFRTAADRRSRRESRTVFGMIRPKADPEADEELRRLRAEAQEALGAARTEAARILENARAEAREIRANARNQADRLFEEEKSRFQARAVREMIEDYRTEDAALHEDSAESRRKLCLNLESTHSDLCDRMTRLQADMCDALNAARTAMTGELVRWREELYRVETMDLAGCYVNLCGMLAALDRRIAETSSADSPQPVADELSRIRRSFGRFEKQLRSAMLGVGLDVYFPQPGDSFDPARHVVEDDTDPDELEGREIIACLRPGVQQKKPGLDAFEALVRAEVRLRQEAFE